MVSARDLLFLHSPCRWWSIPSGLPFPFRAGRDVTREDPLMAQFENLYHFPPPYRLSEQSGHSCPSCSVKRLSRYDIVVNTLFNNWYRRHTNSRRADCRPPLCLLRVPADGSRLCRLGQRLGPVGYQEGDQQAEEVDGCRDVEAELPAKPLHRKED